MINNQNQTPIDNSIFTHYVGVKFINGSRTYYFGVSNLELKIGDKVVVETVRGLELGEISIEMKSMDEYRSQSGLKPVIRKASEQDVKAYEANLKAATFALEICKTESQLLALEMNLTSAEYTLDKSKVIISYLADNRVDFRELLKVLASKLHTRIELRQIGSRDKSKMIGGLGMCGLKLCCSVFLNEFDGISVNLAKNQMLAINIPKLSGQCGRLLCCLKYEDEAYTYAKKDLPDLGLKVFIDKVEYTVNSVNVISKTVTLKNDDGFVTLPIEEFENQTSFKSKVDIAKENNNHGEKNFHHNKQQFFDKNNDKQNPNDEEK